MIWRKLWLQESWISLVDDLDHPSVARVRLLSKLDKIVEDILQACIRKT
jgi:hypothetical protein